MWGFNRINSGRSIPTQIKLMQCLHSRLVSIVSIQADQSRLDFNGITYRCAESGFNRINSGRSIPTLDSKLDSSELTSGFNRINSGRSIPTIAAADAKAQQDKVSIVSIQADQSRQLPLGSQSWRGSQRLNGGTYFFNRKMIKIYTVNLYKI